MTKFWEANFARFSSFAAVALAASALAGAPEYEVTIIQGPDCGIFGPTPIAIWGLNDLGDGCGSYSHCDPPTTGEGFTWSVRDGISVIPRPPGADTLTASDLNSKGVVVGHYAIPFSGFGNRAFRRIDGTVEFLGIPEGGSFSRAIAINDIGWIVGDWGSPQHALLRGDSDLIDLGALLPGSRSQAFDINDRGQIVGWEGPSIAQKRAFCWEEGRFISLGMLPRGVESVARAINNNGVIVGTGRVLYDSPSGTTTHPFRYEDGVMADLGVLPGLTAGAADDVNDAGAIVGSCQDSTGGIHRAFIWHNGIMRDLNDLIDPDLGLEIFGASAINNVGQIAAFAFNQDGDQVGVILTPVQKPVIPADLTDDGIVDGDDLMMLLSSWSIPPSAPGCKGAPGGCPADINQDGVVNGIDLGILLANWTISPI